MRRTGREKQREKEREREREREGGGGRGVWTYKPFEIPFTIAAICVTKTALRVRSQPGILNADVSSCAIGQVCERDMRCTARIDYASRTKACNAKSKSWVGRQRQAQDGDVLH